MNNTATIYYADSTKPKKELFRKPTLKEAQEVVGGYVELVHPKVSPGYTLIVDEEGRMKGKPLNEMGCRLYGGDIVGDIIVLTGWRGI